VALRLGRDRVVLTLIGGGAFGNPIDLIWESILWALSEVETLVSAPLDVVINGRNLGATIDRTSILDAVRPRGGALLVWPRSALPAIHR
jgi:hypothetical protein